MWCAFHASIRESYYMCTFNNISIKLTCAVCIFCRMNHVIFTSFLCFFCSRALHADFFSSSFSWCFSLCSRLDHLLPFFSHSYSIHCRLLSIGNRDIFIRFEFRLHSVSCVRSILFAFSLSLSLARSLGFGTKRKSSSGCGVLNKSKRHPVCAYMQMYVIKIIESHTKC